MYSGTWSSPTGYAGGYSSRSLSPTRREPPLSPSTPMSGRHQGYGYGSPRESPREWSPMPAESPASPRVSQREAPRVSQSQRELVLAAVQRRWNDPNGLPDVVKDVQAALLLPSMVSSIRVIEDVLGKPLPADMIEQCRSQDQPPPCSNGMMCPYVSERSHLDRYSHPCPRYYDKGYCSLMDNPTHTKFYSHGDVRPVGSSPIGVLDSMEVAPLSQSPTAHTRPEYTTPGSAYSASAAYSGGYQYNTPIMSMYGLDGVRASESPRGGTSPHTPETPPSATRFADQTPPMKAWQDYLALLQQKNIMSLVNMYGKDPYVSAEQKTEGMVRAYRGTANVKRFLIWLTNRIRNPSGVAVVSVVKGRDPNTVRAIWKCPPSGLNNVKEEVTFSSAGAIIKQTVVIDYKKPEKTTTSVSKVFVDRAPPEPFSNDPRLRGTPLTPKKEIRPRVSTPPCQGANCSRASPTHYSRASPVPYTPQPTPKRTYKRKVVPSPLPHKGEENVEAAFDFSDPVEKREAEHAATRIQAGFRGKLARKEVQELQEHNEQTQAATKIQANFRGKKARVGLEEKREEREQEQAATKIQASFRGKKTRREVQEKRDQEHEEQEHAATKIQASFRGKKTRREVQEKRDQEHEEQSHAATKIQASFRGKKTRREVQEKKDQEHEEQKQAATKIQASFRGKKTRREVQEKKDQEHEEQKQAATKIQANFRGKKVRSEFEKHRNGL